MPRAPRSEQRPPLKKGAGNTAPPPLYAELMRAAFACDVDAMVVALLGAALGDYQRCRPSPVATAALAHPRDGQGLTPLHATLIYGKFTRNLSDLVRLLLAAGSPVNPRTGSRAAARHAWQQYRPPGATGEPYWVRSLRRGTTALAMARDSAFIVQLLMAAGADPLRPWHAGGPTLLRQALGGGRLLGDLTEGALRLHLPSLLAPGSGSHDGSSAAAATEAARGRSERRWLAELPPRYLCDLVCAVSRSCPPAELRGLLALAPPLSAPQAASLLRTCSERRAGGEWLPRLQAALGATAHLPTSEVCAHGEALWSDLAEGVIFWGGPCAGQLPCLRLLLQRGGRPSWRALLQVVQSREPSQEEALLLLRELLRAAAGPPRPPALGTEAEPLLASSVLQRPDQDGRVVYFHNWHGRHYCPFTALSEVYVEVRALGARLGLSHGACCHRGPASGRPFNAGHGSPPASPALPPPAARLRQGRPPGAGAPAGAGGHLPAALVARVPQDQVVRRGRPLALPHRGPGRAPLVPGGLAAARQRLPVPPREPAPAGQASWGRGL